ncbi:RES domain-containing protein [Litoribacter alkaliphilus]|uniref:RES domain-containing protein n=1 Tax=Litoribacter ruber TaxID=702568 RepID=A0AAP2G1B2_9BACT|nr:RES domain-containing protein [Litoribacter alkaliphilus]MBS9523867.1 RES domain-containing protein [Litoribacter alkaliphilus]
MELFRITYQEFANELFAPGFAGRWNKDGEAVIYSASSRSLACLENLVHRRVSSPLKSFRTMVIYAPDQVSIQQISVSALPKSWNQDSYCPKCEELGSSWFQQKKTLLLKVPSAVIPDEFNYVINTRHEDFAQVKIIDVLPFYFDKRL